MCISDQPSSVDVAILTPMWKGHSLLASVVVCTHLVVTNYRCGWLHHTTVSNSPAHTHHCWTHTQRSIHGYNCMPVHKLYYEIKV